MDFMESKFMTDLANGELPEVEISISTIALRNLAIMLVITAVIIIMLNLLLKKLV